MEEELSTLAKRKIDNILKSAPCNAKRLAEHYLSHGFQSIEGLSNISFLEDVKGKSINRMLNNIVKKVEKRIGKNNLNELKKTYKRETIIRVCGALLTFEKIISIQPKLDVWKYSDDHAKARRYFERKYKKIIRAADVLLTGRAANDSQKIAILEIKSTYTNALANLSKIQIKIEELAINPLQAKALALASKTLLLPLNQFSNQFANMLWPGSLDAEKHLEEYLKQLSNYRFKKPKSRPENIFENALLIVVYKLLTKPDEQIKSLLGLTANIVGQYFNKRITSKKVENALRGPA